MTVALTVFALAFSSFPGLAEVTPSPTVATPPSEGSSPSQARRLLKEFRRAQFSELRALEHRHRLELKELEASQIARRKEWERKEKGERHHFFSENKKGPERRKYIQDFLVRRRAFRQLLADERSRRIQEQKVRLTSLKEDQELKLKEFKETLKGGRKPANDLWPRS